MQIGIDQAKEEVMDGKDYRISRRDFMRLSATCAAGIAASPSLIIETGHAGEAFTFAYISDSHLLVTEIGFGE